MFDRPIEEIEKAVGFKPDTLCIFCEQPVGSLSMGGPLICPACDCGSYRQDHPDKLKRGKKWGGDMPIFYANAKRRMAELYKHAQRKASDVSEPVNLPNTEKEHSTSNK